MQEIFTNLSQVLQTSQSLMMLSPIFSNISYFHKIRVISLLISLRIESQRSDLLRTYAVEEEMKVFFFFQNPQPQRNGC